MEGNQEGFPDYAEELQKCKDFLAQYQVRELRFNAPVFRCMLTLPPESKRVCQEPLRTPPRNNSLSLRHPPRCLHWWWWLRWVRVVSMRCVSCCANRRYNCSTAAWPPQAEVEVCNVRISLLKEGSICRAKSSAYLLHTKAVSQRYMEGRSPAPGHATDTQNRQVRPQKAAGFTYRAYNSKQAGSSMKQATSSRYPVHVVWTL